MPDTPGQKPNEAAQQVDAVVEQVVEQVQGPEKEKKKLKVKMKAAKERAKLTTLVALGESLSGIGNLWRGFKEFLKGVFSGMKDEMPDKPETKKQEKARSKRRMKRQTEMSKEVSEQHKKDAAYCEEKMKKPGWNEALNVVSRHYQVCPATLIAIVKPESNFNSEAYPPKVDKETGKIIRDANGKPVPASTARNLGQLLWGKKNPGERRVFFQTEAKYWSLTPELKRHQTPVKPMQITKEMTDTDPIVGWIQLAWLTQKNAKYLKVDARDQANASILGIAHHEGKGSARKMVEGIPVDVPETYQHKCKNYEEYRQYIYFQYAKKIGGVATVLAEEHGRTLEAIEKTG